MSVAFWPWRAVGYMPLEREIIASIYGMKVILPGGLFLNGQMVTYYVLTDDLPKSENWTAQLKLDNINLFCEEKNSVLLKSSKK